MPHTFARTVAATAIAGVLSIAGSACSSSAAAPPPICSQLAAATDITGISVAIDNVAPGHDYSANELQAEPVVNTSCPDQAYKLQRYREQILNTG